LFTRSLFLPWIAFENYTLFWIYRKHVTLSEEILKRHYEFVERYKEKLKQLKAHLEAVEKAKGKVKVEAEVKIDDEHHRVNIGAMLGEDCRLSNGVVAPPGVIVGNYSQIQALKLISGRLPDRSLVF
jgi:acetyltransferase-like isoleucine patch superfamily enzyme